MNAWRVVLWILTAGITTALYCEYAIPSGSTFLCLVLLALVLAPIAFLLAVALPFPAMRGHRLALGAWLIGTIALLDAAHAAGLMGAQKRFEALRPAMESQLQKSSGPRFFFQGETLPNQRRYYVWCGTQAPPRFRVVISRGQGWYEVQE